MGLKVDHLGLGAVSRGQLVENRANLRGLAGLATQVAITTYPTAILLSKMEPGVLPSGPANLTTKS